mmetsp:Transcript_786/g.1750  ORF Transcript_786/g.1750 Transcript_786/m.1750 type:complete len:224 (+) Transcript_786:103-774(+)
MPQRVIGILAQGFLSLRHARSTKMPVGHSGCLVQPPTGASASSLRAKEATVKPFGESVDAKDSDVAARPIPALPPPLARPLGGAGFCFGGCGGCGSGGCCCASWPTAEAGADVPKAAVIGMGMTAAAGIAPGIAAGKPLAAMATGCRPPPGRPTGKPPGTPAAITTGIAMPPGAAAICTAPAPMGPNGQKNICGAAPLTPGTPMGRTADMPAFHGGVTPICCC